MSVLARKEPQGIPFGIDLWNPNACDKVGWLVQPKRSLFSSAQLSAEEEPFFRRLVAWRCSQKNPT